MFLTGSSPAPSTYLATHVHSVPENLVDYDCLPADYGDHENDAALSDSAGTAKIDINNRSAKHFISPTLYTSSSLFYRFYVWMQSPHRMHVPLPGLRRIPYPFALPTAMLQLTKKIILTHSISLTDSSTSGN